MHAFKGKIVKKCIFDAALDMPFYTVNWYGSLQFYQIHDSVGSLF
jgi:hypothetical protein